MRWFSVIAVFLSFMINIGGVILLCVFSRFLLIPYAALFLIAVHVQAAGLVFELFDKKINGSRFLIQYLALYPKLFLDVFVRIIAMTLVLGVRLVLFISAAIGAIAVSLIWLISFVQRLSGINRDFLTDTGLLNSGFAALYGIVFYIFYFRFLKKASEKETFDQANMQSEIHGIVDNLISCFQ